MEDYINRYSNHKKHVKIQKQDVRDLKLFSEAIAAPPQKDDPHPEETVNQNVQTLLRLYKSFPPTKDVLSSLYAEWDVLIDEVERRYDKEARDLYKDYLARLQTKAIANILTILLYVRMLKRTGQVTPDLDDVLLWIHAAWSLDNDWADQAGMGWDELEKFKPDDIRKDWVALAVVVDQLDFKSVYGGIIGEGLARFDGAQRSRVTA